MSATPSTRSFSIAETDVDRAVTMTRLFVEALNARDLDGLTNLVGEDVEFRNAVAGRALHGREALEAIVRAAREARVRLVRRDAEEVATEDGLIRVIVPVIEFVGGSELHGTAIFDVRDERIVSFEVSSEQLRS